MHVGVMGAGAVGCLLGGQLAAAKVRVTLIGRASLNEDIAKHGLTLTGVDGRQIVVPSDALCAETDPATLSDCDVVLVCVKSTATADAASEMGKHLRQDCLLVSFQNGVTNPRRIREGLLRLDATSRPEVSISPGIVHFNVVAKGDGAFAQTTDGALSVGRPDGLSAEQTKTFDALVDNLRRGGFTVKVEDDILAEQYAKLVVNLNNAIISIAGRPTIEVIQDGAYRRIVADVIDEALDVLHASDIKLASFRGVPLRMMPKIFRLPSFLLRALLRPMLKVSPDARPSMWSDLERGRPTEVDDLNGEIVRLGIEHNHPAPLNTAIVTLVHAAEASDTISPCLTPDAFRRALASA